MQIHSYFFKCARFWINSSCTVFCEAIDYKFTHFGCLFYLTHLISTAFKVIFFYLMKVKSASQSLTLIGFLNDVIGSSFTTSRMPTDTDKINTGSLQIRTSVYISALPVIRSSGYKSFHFSDGMEGFSLFVWCRYCEDRLCLAEVNQEVVCSLKHSGNKLIIVSVNV